MADNQLLELLPPLPSNQYWEVKKAQQNSLYLLTLVEEDTDGGLRVVEERVLASLERLTIVKAAREIIVVRNNEKTILGIYKTH